MDPTANRLNLDDAVILKDIISTRKKPQFILASDDSFYEDHYFRNPIGTYPAGIWLFKVQSHLAIREREALENDPAYRQIIPYTVITQMENGVKKFIPYVRTEAGAEDRLHNKASVGFGGHIDLNSIAFTASTSVVDLYATLINSARRELNEELRIVGPVSERPVTFASHGEFQLTNTFIVSDASEVDRVHLGVIVLFHLPEGIQIEANEPDHVVSHPQTAEEILARDEPGAAQPWELESWSKLYLNFILNEPRVR